MPMACSTPPNSQFKQNAKQIGDQLFGHLAKREYSQLLKLYDKRFFERITPAGWADSLDKLEEKVGRFQTLKQTSSSVQHGFNRNSPATTVLVYRVQYDKTYSIQKLTFISDANAENMRVVGHYIDFPETN